MEKFVTSLQRGLEILEAFTPAEAKLKLRELTLKTGLPKTTVFRLLKTLISLDYVHFNSEAKQYSLGPRVMSLGFTVLSSLDLRDAALPHIEDLSRIADQNVNLGILDRTEVVYIERIKKRRILNIDHHVGSRLNIYQSSIGRAILAFLRKDKFREVLREILKDREAVKHIGPNGEQLLEKLQETHLKGYALNDEEMTPGLRAIGAPVFNAQGEVEAAINIPVFSQMVSREELIQRYAPLLLDTAKKVSAARGFVSYATENSGSPQSDSK